MWQMSLSWLPSSYYLWPNEHSLSIYVHTRKFKLDIVEEHGSQWLLLKAGYTVGKIKTNKHGKNQLSWRFSTNGSSAKKRITNPSTRSCSGYLRRRRCFEIIQGILGKSLTGSPNCRNQDLLFSLDKRTTPEGTKTILKYPCPETAKAAGLCNRKQEICRCL